MREQGDSTLVAGAWFIMVVEQFVELRGPGEQGNDQKGAESEEGSQMPEGAPLSSAGRSERFCAALPFSLLLQLVRIKQEALNLCKAKVVPDEEGGAGGLFATRCPGSFKAVRTGAEELEAVLDLGEAVLALQRLLEFVEDAVVEFNDALALAANEVVVVVALGIVIRQFEAACSIGEIDAVDESHGFEQLHGAIDCGEVTVGILDCCGDFLGGAGAGEADKGLEDGASRAGDASGLLPQPVHPLAGGRVALAAAWLFSRHRKAEPSGACGWCQGSS